jgi:hypothetical protein
MRTFLAYVVLSVIAVSLYAGVAAARGHSGFALDDAWIHQTYARNWAETGQLAYIVGQPSAGSTAPLWTWLISFAYRLRIDPYLWTLLLGALSLALSATALARLADRLMPDRKTFARLIGVACVFEWHMLWAAASGMETMLFIALALWVIDRAFANARGWSMGALGGLLILTRPEGLVLIGLAAVVLLTRLDHGGPKSLVSFRAASRREISPRKDQDFSSQKNAPRNDSLRSYKDFFVMLITTLVVVAPGALINYQASGTFFPNTFYAKQQEYASLMSSASIWLSSIGNMIVAPLAGAGFLLLPGVLIWLLVNRSIVRFKSQWVRALPLIWIGLHIFIYAVRLPVAYQHGRYLMPIIPIVLLYGFAGISTLAPLRGAVRVGLDRRSASQKSMRLIAWAMIASIAIVLIAFIPIGAAAFATDVAIIDAEMVQVAHWLSINTPPDALVAAHDIGAIGYFARRPLIDLAGLISPEVIPIIRDEDQLRRLIETRQASYLVTFPDWYPALLRSSMFTAVFSGDSIFSPQHLTVYAVRP